MHSERLQLVGQIELTEAEQELARKIAFDLDNIRLEHEQAIENGELAATLMQCLIDRKAIPENRLRYFGDPDYNPNNAKASKANLFLRNAKTLDLRCGLASRNQGGFFCEGSGALCHLRGTGPTCPQSGAQFSPYPLSPSPQSPRHLLSTGT